MQRVKMKFLDMKTDFAFKKVFGSADSVPRLISFLNSILYKDQIVKIDTLEIVDPYNIPMLKGMKDTFVDVKAVLSNKTKVIIEMQVLSHEGFEKRVLYSAAKNYSVQLDKGDDYSLLNPVIALTIVDFIMFDDIDGYLSKFKLIEKDKFVKYSDDFELIFVELPKFEKSIEELNGIEDEWIWFVKKSGSMEYVPKNLNKEIKTAFDVSNEANMSKDELEVQHKKLEFNLIQKSSISQALKQGLEQGIEQGSLNTNRENARSMYQKDIDISVIKEVTGLSETEILELVKDR